MSGTSDPNASKNTSWALRLGKYYVNILRWLGDQQSKLWVTLGLGSLAAGIIGNIASSFFTDKAFLSDLAFVTWLSNPVFICVLIVLSIVEINILAIKAIYIERSAITTVPLPQPGNPNTPPSNKGKKRLRMGLLLCVLVGLLIGAGCRVWIYAHPLGRGLGQFFWYNGQLTACDATCATDLSQKGQRLGICDGSCAFDYTRVNEVYKQQAVKYTNEQQYALAELYWQWASEADVTDAESKIYQEDTDIVQKNQEHITVAVVVSLTLTNSQQIVAPDEAAVNDGRDTLQGAYVMQKVYNQNNPLGPKLLLQIVNIGQVISNADSQSTDWSAIQDAIADRIDLEARRDQQYLGVIGLPFGSDQLINDLNADAIPMISTAAGANDDQIAYLRRVAPSLQDEANDAASYIEAYLQKNGGNYIDVMFESGNDYSTTLKDKFIEAFTKLPAAPKAHPSPFTAGSQSAIQDSASTIISENANAVFFIGTPDDAIKLRNILPHSIPIIGSDALFKYVHMSEENKLALVGLTFFSFGFHDQWSNEMAKATSGMMLHYPKPAILDVYGREFNPGNKRLGNYSYDRASSTTLLAYDALGLLTTAGQASSNLTSNECPLPQKQQASSTREMRWTYVQACTENHPFDGATGQIAFSTISSNPINKAVLVLEVAQNNGNAVTHFDQLYGQFFMGETTSFSQESRA